MTFQTFTFSFFRIWAKRCSSSDVAYFLAQRGKNNVFTV